MQYSALLRLPRELSFREKLARVEKIIEMLHLQDCANTCMYNNTKCYNHALLIRTIAVFILWSFIFSYSDW